MKLFRKKFLKLGNKGLSMVELICSITILAIIGTSISSILVVSADSYDRGSAEAEVQQEAQLVANQISDLLIDATSDVDMVGDTLTIQQTDGSVYQVRFDSADKKLYYSQQVMVGGVLTSSGEQLMAEGVTAFSVDVSDYNETGYARMNITFENDNQQYPAVFTVTARNREVDYANEVTAAIVLPAEITLEPYQTYTFTPSLYGINNTVLNWEVLGNTDSNTTINSTGTTGTIRIGDNEMATPVRVRATAVEDGAVVAERYVNVNVRRVNDIPVTIIGTNGTPCTAGTQYTLHADVQGLNLDQVVGADYDTDYIDPRNQISWAVTGNTGGISCSIISTGDPATVILR